MKNSNLSINSPWVGESRNGLKILHAGVIENYEKLVELLLNDPHDLAQIQNLLRQEHQSYGIIIKSANFSFAVCDRTQSYPIYYNVKTNEISHDIFKLTEKKLRENYDETALLEFSCAGYVLGNKTLDKDIRQIQAGELIHMNNENQTTIITKCRYYSYIPKPTNNQKSNKKWISDLNNIIDNIIIRSIEQANGRPICVPLSGGLDSRLIVAKLQEHGVKNIHTFSYGLSDNFEAKRAQKVARQISLDWFMVPAEPKKAKNLFQSDTRKLYAQQAHGLSKIPSYVEYEALNTVKENNMIPEDCMIINGQTGDYISGGHVPECLYKKDNPTEDDLYNYIIEKHFSLWKNLKTSENIQKLKQSISESLLPNNADMSLKDNLISRYESFEWQERQCKMVVHGQKIYDFFGYGWSLPLWDRELMDFFETVPWELKYRQKLFKDYLKDYNYKGIFEYPSATPEIWKPHQYWIVITARIIGLINSQEAKQDFYKKMSYYGDAHWQYALFDKKLYDKHYKEIRNMISFTILDFLTEYEIKFPIKTH